MPNSKSLTRTLRIEKGLDRILQDISDKEKVSVNFLVNKTLRRFAEWDVFAEKFGFTNIPSELLTKMIEKLDQEEMRELGRWCGTNLAKEFMQFFFGKSVSIETIFQTVRLLGSDYVNWFKYEHKATDHGHILILRGLGPKWSVFYEELFNSVFNSLVTEEPARFKVERTDSQLVVSIDVARDLPLL